MPPPPQQNARVDSNLDALCKTGMACQTARLGFTLAEVLITLGIIGVVAALTMGTLIPHLEKVTTETKLKKFYNVISNATDKAMLTHGDWSTWDYSLSANAFYEKYYKDQLVIDRVACISNNKFTNCGKYDNYKTHYLFLNDGNCVFLKKNDSDNSIKGYYWHINTSCFKKIISGRNDFELSLFNFKNMKYRCNYSPYYCGFTGDGYYDGDKDWAKNRPSDSKDVYNLCTNKSGDPAWNTYQCYYRFVSEGMKFSKNYYFFKKP